MLGTVHIDATVPQALRAGKAFVIARPEDIAITDAAGGVATISSRQYLGDVTHYRLTIGRDLSVAVALHGPGHDRHEVGRVVSLAFDSAKTLVVAE
jgi:TOBE domain